MSIYDEAAIVVVLPVTDLVRAESWYGRLGFGVVASYPTYLVLDARGLELHLFVRSHEADGTSWSGAYLRVADVDAVHRAWAAAGARILLEPTDRDHGQREFAAEDPDGNLWRVGTPIPGIADALAAAIRSEGHAPSTASSGPPDGGPHDGSPGTPDDRWFALVASGRCGGCDYDPSGTPPAQLPGVIVDEASRWGPVLLGAEDEAVRRRPTPTTWSALEYGAHVRDVLAVFTQRTVKMLAEPDPDLGWWDHEAAIEDGWANESEVGAVVDDLAENASRLRQALTAMPADGWARTGTRAGGEAFTIESLLRFAVHELVHHRADAERGLAAREA